jgi:DNA-binding transcriptional MerR regulator
LKNKAGHRLYSPRDIYIINNIRELLYNQGYSISGAKKVLWDILLGRKNTNLKLYIDELKKDLYELIEVINKSLNDESSSSQV